MSEDEIEFSDIFLNNAHLYEINDSNNNILQIFTDIFAKKFKRKKEYDIKKEDCS